MTAEKLGRCSKGSYAGQTERQTDTVDDCLRFRFRRLSSGVIFAQRERRRREDTSVVDEEDDPGVGGAVPGILKVF